MLLDIYFFIHRWRWSNQTTKTNSQSASPCRVTIDTRPLKGSGLCFLSSFTLDFSAFLVLVMAILSLSRLLLIPIFFVCLLLDGRLKPADWWDHRFTTTVYADMLTDV